MVLDLVNCSLVEYLMMLSVAGIRREKEQQPWLAKLGP